MNTLAIIVWVCTSGPNPVCPAEPHEIAVLDGEAMAATPYACMGPSTQLSLLSFRRSHPGLTVRKWACGASRRGQVAKI